MRKTEAYRQHHDELRDIARRIEAHLDENAVAASPDAVAEVVRTLFGKFTVHLALEDRSLYPRCAGHANARLRDTATRFQTEMGDLAGKLEVYRGRWPGPLAIRRDPAAFVAETRTILGLLRARVAREEQELYDLIDAA